jgi:Ca-activated chloride channel homolog
VKIWKIFLLMLAIVFLVSACGKSDEASKETKQKEDKTVQSKEEDTEASGASEELDSTFTYPASLEEAEMAVTGDWWDEKDDPTDSQEDDLLKEIAKVGNGSGTTEENAAAIDSLLFSHFHPELPAFTAFEPRGKITLEDLNTGSGLKLNGKEVKKNINIAIILDASGSMKAKQGGKSRMEIAKDAVEDFVSNLPENTKVSLTLYGHKGTSKDADKELSCKAIDEVYPLETYDSGKFDRALEDAVPKGWTPIASALEKAGKSLEGNNSEDHTNVIYLVSDGEETCDGDPAKAAEKLVSSNIEPIINVIGFAVNQDQQKQLEEVAKAAEGRYIQANNQQELVNEFRSSNQAMVKWINWRNQHTVDAINQKNQDHVEHISLKNKMNLRLINYKNKVSMLLINAKNKYDLDPEVSSLSREHVETYFSERIDELEDRFKEQRDAIDETYDETKSEIDDTYESNKEE